MTSPGTRDIVVDVTIRSDTKGAREGATALGEVDKAAGGAGKSMKGMEVDAKSLDAQIGKSKQTVKDLETELTKVGNNPGLRKSLRVERSWLSELEKIQKSLNDGQKAGSAFSSALSSAVEGVGGIGVKGALITVLVGAAVAAAPMVGAIIGGAVAGGVGTLGVAAGVAAATHDPAVQAAFSDLADTAKAEFFSIGESFVGPTVASIGVLKRAVVDINLKEIFAQAAPSVEVIATGIADLVRNIMPGLNAAMGRIGPFAAVAAEGFGQLGDALGGFLDDVTRSPGAIEGLKAAFMLIEGTVRLVGKGIYGLAEAYHWLLEKAYAAAVATATLADSIPGMSGLGDAARHVAFVVKEMQNVPGAADGASGSFDRFADGATKSAAKLDPFVQYLWEAKHGVDGLHDVLLTLFADEMGMDQATLRWQEDILKLTEATQKHGHTLDTNTQAGLDNRRMILGLIQDADAIRKATTNQTGSIEEGNRAYERELILLKEKLEKLHFTKAQIDEMVGEYYINVDINLNYRTSGSFSQQAKNLALADRLDASHRADGGPVMAGVPYKINERGYETVTFPSGGTVHPANLTPMGGGGSASARPLIVNGDGLADVFMSWLRNTVGQQGGTLAVLGVRT